MMPPRVESVWMKLPQELAVDILSRLEGKELVRSKCVCPDWRSVIESRHFSDHYRKSHGLVIYNWSEEVPASPERIRIRVYSTPLNRQEEFRGRLDLQVRKADKVTQVVDGLVCIATLEEEEEEPQIWSTNVASLYLYNVFTGQRIELCRPKVIPSSVSSFHLGQDPVTKAYKLLRVIYPCTFQGIMNWPIQAKIMTIRQGLDGLCWRNLKWEEGGLDCFMVMSEYFFHAYNSLRFHQSRTFTGDGALCWFWWFKKCLILFDLNKEMFRMVKLPQEVQNMFGIPRFTEKSIIPRFTENGLSVWIGPYDDVLGSEWYAMDDDDGLEWSKHLLQIPEPNGASTSASLGELMLVDDNQPESMTVYRYPKMSQRFVIGKLPENRHLDYDVMCPGSEGLGFDTRLACLSDSVHSYLPLVRVVNGLD